MFFCTPRSMEATTIATVVPTTTPSTVRKERTLCERMVSMAIFTSSISRWEWRMLNLKPQGFDWIKLGGFVSRINPKEYPDQRGDEKSNKDPANRQLHGKWREMGYGE